jgi:hypothetical protein
MEILEDVSDEDVEVSPEVELPQQIIFHHPMILLKFNH